MTVLPILARRPPSPAPLGSHSTTPARVGNSRFGLLERVLHTHTNAQYEVNLLLETLRMRECPGAGPDGERGKVGRLVRVQLFRPAEVRLVCPRHLGVDVN